MTQPERLQPRSPYIETAVLNTSTAAPATDCHSGRVGKGNQERDTEPVSILLQRLTPQLRFW